MHSCDHVILRPQIEFEISQSLGKTYRALALEIMKGLCFFGTTSLNCVRQNDVSAFAGSMEARVFSEQFSCSHSCLAQALKTYHTFFSRASSICSPVQLCFTPWLVALFVFFHM